MSDYTPTSKHFPEGMTAERVEELRAERSQEWQPTEEWRESLETNHEMALEAGDPEGPLFDSVDRGRRELKDFDLNNIPDLVDPTTEETLRSVSDLPDDALFADD